MSCLRSYNQSWFYSHLFRRHTNWYFIYQFFFPSIVTCLIESLAEPIVSKFYLLLATPQDILSYVHYKSAGIHNVCANNYFPDNVCNKHLVIKLVEIQM